MAKLKTIPIRCKGASTLKLSELHDFQGNLKVLTFENQGKLEREILELGFSEPVSVWVDKKKKAHILNGHQRVRTVKALVERGSHACPGLPVSFVEADNMKQAKQKVLALTSQYGSMTDDGLREFLDDSGLGLEDLERFEFPEINLDNFRLEAEGEKAPGEKVAVSFDAYQNAAIKQIVVYLAREDYDKALPKLDALMDKWELEDYSQVIWRLINEAVPALSKRD